MGNGRESLIADAELDEMLDLTDEEAAIIAEAEGVKPEEKDESEGEDEEGEGEEGSEEEGSEEREGEDEEGESEGDEDGEGEEGEAGDSGEADSASARSDAERGPEAALRREVEGLKRDLFRSRERYRVAESKLRTMQQPEKIRVPHDAIEEGEDGEVTIDGAALQRAQTEGMSTQERFAQNYSNMRHNALQNVAASEREGLEESINKLEEAYFWLDKELTDVSKEIGIGAEQLNSLGQIRRVMDAEGLTPKFNEQYPGLRVEDLILGAIDPYMFETTARSYMGTLQELAKKGDESKSDEERAVENADRTLKLKGRPRSMSSRGTGHRAGKKTAKQFAETSADELFDMTDDEFKEMEAAARS